MSSVNLAAIAREMGRIPSFPAEPLAVMVTTYGFDTERVRGDGHGRLPNT